MNQRTVILVSHEVVYAARLTCRHRSWSVETRSQTPCDSPRTIDEATVVDELVDAIADVVAESNANGDEVDLIIPASWCFVHHLKLQSKRAGAEAVAFSLEEFVPVPIERLTCTWLPVDQESVWAIATQTEPIRNLLDRLLDRGVEVRRILVDALVARLMIDENTCGLAIRDTGRITFVTDHFIRTVLCDDGGYDWQLRFTSEISGVNQDDWAELGLNEPIESGEKDSHENSLQVQDLLIAAADDAHPDLRVGELGSHRRYTNLVLHAARCAVLVAGLFVALIVRDLVVTRQLRVQSDQIQTLQVKAFARAFPDRTPPASPSLILASERKRLEGLTRSKPTETDDVNQDADRLLLLNDLATFVSGLSEDLRVRLVEVNIDAQQFSLRGQTTDHRHAERIAEALRQVPQIECGLPRTSRLPGGGVEFSVRGKRNLSPANDEIGQGS